MFYRRTDNQYHKKCTNDEWQKYIYDLNTHWKHKNAFILLFRVILETIAAYRSNLFEIITHHWSFLDSLKKPVTEFQTFKYIKRIRSIFG